MAGIETLTIVESNGPMREPMEAINNTIHLYDKPDSFLTVYSLLTADF